MLCKKARICVFPLTLALSMGLVVSSAALFSLRVQAEETNTNNKLEVKWNGYEPPDRGTPGRLEGGGTRGICITDSSDQLTALLPETSAALTISEYPSFFVYVPINYAEKEVKFTLLKQTGDGKEQEVYTTNLTTPSQSGIMKVNVPKTTKVQPLEIGKNYYWSFSVICNPDKREQDRVVSGWVKRIDGNQIIAKTDSDRLRAYKNQALWYDTLVTLAEKRNQEPNNRQIISEWENVLKEVKLDRIINKPLLP
jgi:hypothetical protein